MAQGALNAAVATNGGDSGGIDILSDVALVSFNATPDHIGSFGASQLAWAVTGPQTGWHVTLNGTSVARASGEIVQPQTTTSYHLNAVAVGVTKSLGTINVHVDDSGCETAPILNPHIPIAALLNAEIEARKDLYFNDNTEVIFSPGTIRFKLHLGKHVPRIADPSVEIDASLGLAVDQGHIVSIVQNIDATVSLPWYESWLANASSQVALLLANGTADARNAAQEMITGIGTLVDLLAVFSSNIIKRNVRIGVDAGGHGTIDIQACPNNLLVILAEASSVGSTG